MSNELKDCPFCGREPEQSERADNNTSTGRAYFIACMCGGYSANAHQFGETKEEVTSKWNCRPIAPVASAAPSGEREKFEAWLRSIWTQGYEPRRDGDEYHDLRVQQYWICWQAAIAHQPPKEAPAHGLPAGTKLYTQEQMQEYAKQVAFDAAIAASAPNKQLVAALRDMLTWFGQYPELVPDEIHYEKYRAAIDSGRAALAAAGEKGE